MPGLSRMLQASAGAGGGFPSLASPLIAHFDADAITGLADASPVASWADLSGNGYDAAEATNRPTYRTNVQNGKPVVRFDGVNDRLQTAAFSAAVTQPYTLFVVSKIGNSDGHVVEGRDATNRALMGTFAGDYYMFSGTAAILMGRDSNFHVFVVIFNGTSSLGRVAGIEADGLSVGTNSLGGITLGARWDKAAKFLNGDICEAALWDGAATADEIAQLETYAVNKWGVVLADDESLFVYEAVNGRSYRTNALASFSAAGVEYQAHCFFNAFGYAVIQVRSDSGGGFGAWSTYPCNGQGGRPTITLSANNDDHLSITLGIDQDGYIHIAYDHHNDALNYRKSSSPIDSFNGAFSAESSMVGTNENAIAYVQFWNDPAGTLYATFRNGSATNGDIFFYQYDESTGWAAAPGTGTGGLLLNGDGAADDTAYFYGVAFDADFATIGSAHFAWCWRNDGNSGNTNHDVGYVRWDGANFTQASGAAQTIPITAANQETADAVAQSTGLSGGGHIASDDNGDPHIVYIKNNGSADAQVWHAWHNGTAWQTPAALTVQTAVTSTGDPENASWRAPNIAINQADGHVYVFYTLLTKTGIYVLDSADYSSWTETQVDASAVGEWSPQFDRWQWANNGAIYMPVQPFYASPLLAFEIVEYVP